MSVTELLEKLNFVRLSLNNEVSRIDRIINILEEGLRKDD